MERHIFRRRQMAMNGSNAATGIWIEGYGCVCVCVRLVYSWIRLQNGCSAGNGLHDEMRHAKIFIENSVWIRQSARRIFLRITIIIPFYVLFVRATQFKSARSGKRLVGAALIPGPYYPSNVDAFVCFACARLFSLCSCCPSPCVWRHPYSCEANLF